MKKNSIFQSLKEKLFGRKKSYLEILAELPVQHQNPDSTKFVLKGIKIHDGIYLDQCTGVHTYVFSSRFNPCKPDSYMNQNFNTLMGNCAGSVLWPDNGKKILSLDFYSENDNQVLWESNMVCIITDQKVSDSELNYQERGLSAIQDFIRKAESFMANKKGITNPQIVVTFSDKFKIPNDIQFLCKILSPFDDIEQLPYWQFPYEKGLIM